MNDPFSTPTKTKRKSKRNNPKLDRALRDARLSDLKNKTAVENEIIAEQKLREELEKRARLSAQKKRAKRKCVSAKDKADAQFRREIRRAQRKHAKAHKKADQDCDVEVSYIAGQILANERDIKEAGNHLENCRDEVQYTQNCQLEAGVDLIIANGGTKKAVSIMAARSPFSTSPARTRKSSDKIDQIETIPLASSMATNPKEAKQSKSRSIQSSTVRRSQRKNDESPDSEIIEISSDDSSIDSFISQSSDGSSVDSA